MQEFKLKVRGPDLEGAQRALEAEDTDIKVQPFGHAERIGEGAEPSREPSLAWLRVTLTSPNEKTALDYIREVLKDLPGDYNVGRIG